jgi:hypothetical protein
MPPDLIDQLAPLDARKLSRRALEAVEVIGREWLQSGRRHVSAPVSSSPSTELRKRTHSPANAIRSE